MSEISDEELSVFMAIEIRGWHKEKRKVIGLNALVQFWVNKDSIVLEVNNYSPPTDLNQAFKCVDRVLGDNKGYAFELDSGWDGEWRGLVYMSTIPKRTLAPNPASGYDKSPARATCLSIKAFKESLK